MSQIIKVWVDLLCSECYSIIKLNIDSSSYDKKVRESDDSEYCEKCQDWVFPIVVMKREFDTRLSVPVGTQLIERSINHGVEIIHIGGEGIVKNLEPSPTGATSPTYYYNLKELRNEGG